MKKIIYNTIVLILLVAGIYYVCSRFIHFGNVEYTDDAQVQQLMTPVNSRVQGFITKVCFEDYQYVHKGDTLALIEDSQYKLQVAQAEAGLANANAGRTVVNSSVNTASAGVETNAAALVEVKVQMDHARRELDRYRNLLDKGAVTQQQYDGVETAYKALQAKYAQMEKVKSTSNAAKDEQTQRVGQSQAGVELAEAQLQLARLNLSYTVITAPCDGYTGKKEVLEGQLIQPGQPIVNIISQDDIWVIANYRETQMQHITDGADVDIEVDALPDIVLKGKVQRISKGTQASYSMVPTGNSAGNFVKVEQRIPVRIIFTENNSQEDISKLRSGLNVECTIKYN